MRISHVIKTDQLRSDPQIRSDRHFVVSRMEQILLPVSSRLHGLEERHQRPYA